MYAITVQNENMVVTNVYSCFNMVEVQEVLEIIEPDMDSEYLISGDAKVISYFNSNEGTSKTYTLLKLEKATNLVEYKYEDF